ncbi:MAG: glucosaminidase domain-containing protein [Alphaproteobacteria bacterium]
MRQPAEGVFTRWVELATAGLVCVAIGFGLMNRWPDRNGVVPDYAWSSVEAGALFKKEPPVLVVPDAVKLAALFAAGGWMAGPETRGETAVKPIFVAAIPKDLKDLPTVTQRKQLFLGALLPLVLEVNDSILEDRDYLQGLARRLADGEDIGDEDRAWLSGLFGAYQVEPGDVGALLERVDVVPSSLALAQAALESGWGTSRFALEGRALFGQRTYGGESGLRPSSVEGGGTFLVRSFPDLRDAVRAYMRNLNTNLAYREFRAQRAESRRQGSGPRGESLVVHLARYSERGHEYVKALGRIIRENNLESLDAARLLRDDPVHVIVPGA